MGSRCSTKSCSCSNVIGQHYTDYNQNLIICRHLCMEISRWASRVDKLQGVRCCTRHLKTRAAPPPSSVSVPRGSVPGRVSAHDAQSAHTLTPWHVPPLANPPLTPLCSITLNNRTINDHCADLKGGWWQPALAASDRIHIGFLHNSVNTQELLYVSRLSCNIPENIGEASL